MPQDPQGSVGAKATLDRAMAVSFNQTRGKCGWPGGRECTGLPRHTAAVGVHGPRSWELLRHSPSSTLSCCIQLHPHLPATPPLPGSPTFPDLLMGAFGLSEDAAVAAISLGVDFGITQLVRAGCRACAARRLRVPHWRPPWRRCHAAAVHRDIGPSEPAGGLARLPPQAPIGAPSPPTRPAGGWQSRRACRHTKGAASQEAGASAAWLPCM